MTKDTQHIKVILAPYIKTLEEGMKRANLTIFQAPKDHKQQRGVR